MKKQTKAFLVGIVCVFGLSFVLAVFLWSLDNHQYLFSLVSIWMGVVFSIGYGMAMGEMHDPKQDASRRKRE